MFHIEPATERDTPVILKFIRDLAEYEGLLDAVEATEADLKASLFGAQPAAEVVIGYVDDLPVGFAMFFQTFSTFVGRPGMYLEDLFVAAAWRGHGFGRRLLAHLAKIAVKRRYGRMEWSVLNWNEQALGVYRRIGAAPMREWTVQRLSGASLQALASSVD